MEALDHARGEEIGVEVLVEALLDARTENLHGDRLRPDVTLTYRGLMHLGDRGGGDRWTEFGEDFADRRFKRVLHRILRLLLRERRETILQRSKIRGELAADDIVAGRKELAELDVGRPEGGERSGKTRFVAGIGSAVGLFFAQRRGH